MGFCMEKRIYPEQTAITLMEQTSSLYLLSEECFLNAYRQQIEMMLNEETAAVTAGLMKA